MCRSFCALTFDRFLNMFSALEALIAVGTCRELPVVGFVGDILVRGVIVNASALWGKAVC